MTVEYRSKLKSTSDLPTLRSIEISFWRYVGLRDVEREIRKVVSLDTLKVSDQQICGRTAYCIEASALISHERYVELRETLLDIAGRRWACRVDGDDLVIQEDSSGGIRLDLWDSITRQRNES